MRRTLAGIVALACLAGCTSGGSSADDPPQVRDMTQGAAEPGEGEARFAGAQTRPALNWKDTTEGEISTLVYVTQMRGKKGNQPGAIIFSSDPTSAHFLRRANPVFVVLRLYKSEMAWLEDELGGLGLEELAWVPEENYDAKIGPARAFHYYKGGKRRYVVKDELSIADKRKFRKIEDRLLELTFLR
jgi:hypothetical protein